MYAIVSTIIFHYFGIRFGESNDTEMTNFTFKNR